MNGEEGWWEPVGHRSSGPPTAHLLAQAAERRSKAPHREHPKVQVDLASPPLHLEMGGLRPASMAEASSLFARVVPPPPWFMPAVLVAAEFSQQAILPRV